MITVASDEAFPQIPNDIDIVFDLAGSISKNSHSITSALEQSDLVIIPIYDEIKCINAGLHTIIEVARFNKNIVVVATKLVKKNTEAGKSWTECSNFKNIQRFVTEKIAFDIPVLPLKFSKGFDIMFNKEQSLLQMRKNNPISNYAYREVSQQFDAIYSLIDQHHAR